MKQILKIILALIIWQGLALPVAAQVPLLNRNISTKIGDQAGNVAEPSYDSNTNAATMTWIVSWIIKIFMGLLGIIFIVIIIIAGYNWMTAGGNEEKVKKAGQLMSRAVIGLIIIAAAYAITVFVFARLPDASQGPGGNSADDGFSTGG